MITDKGYYLYTNNLTQYYIFKVLSVEDEVYANIFFSSRELYLNQKGDSVLSLHIAEGSEIFEDAIPLINARGGIFNYIFLSEGRKMFGTYDERDFKKSLNH